MVIVFGNESILEIKVAEGDVAQLRSTHVNSSHPIG